MTSPDDHIEQRARALFRKASQELDPATAARLRAARRDALQAAGAPPQLARLLLPAGAFAVLALATLLVWQPHEHALATPGRRPSRPATRQRDPDNELPPDADSADPNLYQNLDFYGWLAANDRTAGGTR